MKHSNITGIRILSFPRGGIHPGDEKTTADMNIIAMPPPVTVSIPLVQHIGAPAKACVLVGDKVKVGTLIAEGQGLVSAPVHASVSGTVVKIDSIADPGGFRKPAIIIQTDGDEWEPEIVRNFDLVRNVELRPDEIMDRINDGGLVGKGGATFPTRVKYMIPENKRIDTLIINGVECEPYLTSDHRLMLERTDEVVLGAELLRKTLGVKLAVIAVEVNKPDAIACLRQSVADLGLQAPEDYVTAHLRGKGIARGENPDRSGWLTVVGLKVKYPQGAEKQLIKAVLGREVPSGKLPLDTGAIVNNVATAHSAYKIVCKRKPMVERIVTVAGTGVTRPGNYKIRIGTLISDVLEFAGYVPSGTHKIIIGGPMMGKAITSLQVPVTKGTSGIVVFHDAQVRQPTAGPCIRCSRCVSACPMGLQPYLLERLVGLSRLDEAEANSLKDCVECGSCSYVCPASRPLLDFIRLGKAQLVRAQQIKAAQAAVPNKVNA